MNRSAILAILVLFGTAFAGCLGDDTVDSEHDHSTHDHGSATNDNETVDANRTDPPAPVPELAVNAPPTASLEADVATGEAPLLVTFTVAGDDADGDALTWSLDADGDGTADADGDTLPSDYTHNFTAAGNYTAILTVSDGTDSTEQNLTVAVTEVTEVPPTMPEDIVITGEVTAGVRNPADGYNQAGAGAKPFNFTDNRSVVSKMTLSLEATGNTTFDLDYTVIAPDGTEAGTAATAGLDPEPDIVVEDASLLQQEGDWKVRVDCGLGVKAGYIVTITFE